MKTIFIASVCFIVGYCVGFKRVYKQPEQRTDNFITGLGVGLFVGLSCNKMKPKST